MGERAVSGQDGNNNEMMVFVAIILVLVLVVPSVYAMYAGSINGPLLKLAQLEVLPFRIASDEATLAAIKFGSIDPTSIDWNMMEKILAYAGSWIRWPYAAALAAMVYYSVMYMGRAERLKRKFNMDRLLENNAMNFPCLRPVVGRGKYLLSQESYDRGLWKIARSPVQFALENGIMTYSNGQPCPVGEALENGLGSQDKPAFGQCAFDEARATEVFTAQLGKQFSNFESLSSVRKVIASAFILYAVGKKNECVSILDCMSSSYGENDGKWECPILEDTKFRKKVAAISNNWNDFISRPAVSRHTAYEIPLLMSFLIEARKKGVLACSQFLWLRPMDRPLWYALNQCGGRVAWAESLAPWAHFQAEELTKSALSEANVKAAVSSLEKSLASQGWFTQNQFNPYADDSASGFEEQIDLSLVSAPAEEEIGE